MKYDHAQYRDSSQYLDICSPGHKLFLHWQYRFLVQFFDHKANTLVNTNLLLLLTRLQNTL